jgi:hypothetical protein
LADSFFAFDPAFRGGCWVATGDFNNDGRDELVVSADAGGGPHVKIYSFNDVGAFLVHNQTDSFFAFDPRFTGGARVAVGKFDVSMLSSLQATSPRPMLVVAAGPGGEPDVKIFDNQNFDQRVSDERVIREFMAFGPTFRGGVFVAADNLDRRAAANLVVSAGAGGGPHVRAFHASVVENAMPPIPPSGPPTSLNLEERDSFFAYDLGFTGGVRVALSDLVPTDPNPDLVTAPGSGGRSQVKVWSGDAGTGKVSDRPLEDSFTAFQAPGGTPLDIGVFVAFGST